MDDFHPPHLDGTLELKFVGETGFFEGYASVFHVTDSAHDRIAPGAFAGSLAQFRADGRFPPLLWQHDTREPIGTWREMREDSHGLFVKGELFVHDIPRARETWKLLKENVVTGLSIGYRTRESYHDTKSGIRVLTDVELLEVSIVTFPANTAARILRVKSTLDSGELPTEREFEAFLREAGLSRKQARGFVTFGYRSLLPRDAEGTDSQDAAAALRSLTEKLRELSDL